MYSIISFLNRLSFPTISTISATSLQDFKRKNDVVVVAYVPTNDRDSHEAFSSLAKAMRADYLFGITNDPELAKAEQVHMPGIAIYCASDEERKVRELKHDLDKMSTSIREAARPLIMDFVSEPHEDYLDVSRSNTVSFDGTKPCCLDRSSSWLSLSRYF